MANGVFRHYQAAEKRHLLLSLAMSYFFNSRVD
jgi:hypothetical protein